MGTPWDCVRQGYDEETQRRLTLPQSEEEAQYRKAPRQQQKVWGCCKTVADQCFPGAQTQSGGYIGVGNAC